MPRFFVPMDLTNATSVTLLPEVVRHIQVLRLQQGDDLVLFNGQGGEYRARLTHLGKKEAGCEILGFDTISRESPVWLGLAQSISSADKMEWVIQKGVEMGISVFQPLISERTVIRLSGERAEKRVARWQEIVVSACEQCGRNTIPEVLPILSYKEWIASHDCSQEPSLILSPKDAKRLTELANQPSRMWLMVGPEGGFSREEENEAIDAGWQALTLGPRVLRTETAALAAVSAIQTVWGDYL